MCIESVQNQIMILLTRITPSFQVYVKKQNSKRLSELSRSAPTQACGEDSVFRSDPAEERASTRTDLTNTTTTIGSSAGSTTSSAAPAQTAPSAKSTKDASSTDRAENCTAADSLDCEQNLDEVAEEEDDEEEDPDEAQKLLLERQASLASADIPPTSTRMRPRHSTHDLIPYTGRLLTAEFLFTYTADVETETGESYERTAVQKLAVTIVPALTVTEWQILAGDAPSTRFVVVDVSNLADCDAELTFGAEQRQITVQPKELCR